MKKLLTLLVVSTGIVALTACDTNKKETKTNDTKLVEETKEEIVVPVELTEEELAEIARLEAKYSEVTETMQNYIDAKEASLSLNGYDAARQTAARLDEERSLIKAEIARLNAKHYEITETMQNYMDTKAETLALNGYDALEQSVARLAEERSLIKAEIARLNLKYSEITITMQNHIDSKLVDSVENGMDAARQTAARLAAEKEAFFAAQKEAALLAERTARELEVSVKTEAVRSSISILSLSWDTSVLRMDYTNIAVLNSAKIRINNTINSLQVPSRYDTRGTEQYIKNVQELTQAVRSIDELIAVLQK